MKILTFDTEEWYIEKHFKGGRKEKYRQYDELLDWILNALEKSKTQATFFCVGKLAVEFPEVVRKIANAGHEIGSHSDKHLWVTKMTRQEFAEDMRRSIGEIENLIEDRKSDQQHHPRRSRRKDSAEHRREPDTHLRRPSRKHEKDRHKRRRYCKIRNPPPPF